MSVLVGLVNRSVFRYSIYCFSMIENISFITPSPFEFFICYYENVTHSVT